MRDADRSESGHLMLINPVRVFYAGLLGRPRRRVSGGFNVYVAIDGTLAVDDGLACVKGEVAVVAPYTAHNIDAAFRCVICLVVEPETVAPRELASLAARIAGDPEFVPRVRAAYHDLRARQTGDGFTTAEFDRMAFGRVLAPRDLDPRIAFAATSLHEVAGFNMTAADHAARARLSPSRFLHLFKAETGVSFRALRAWKRARHLLHFVNEDVNLAHLAQDIGYPDSTHFSHSIRRFYGLKPRAIFSGSRDLAIYRSGVAPRSFAGA